MDAAWMNGSQFSRTCGQLSRASGEGFSRNYLASNVALDQPHMTSLGLPSSRTPTVPVELLTKLPAELLEVRTSEYPECTLQQSSLPTSVVIPKRAIRPESLAKSQSCLQTQRLLGPVTTADIPV
ncbi:hypothetical protein P3T76_006484 [Phytophthora citrophthora]|uniref:Uncharacterized protein n=1 Tax=Phytophthora citrophthora TaxID=4793 RepID=A0AAD9GPB5_9STRA|nr:hypothetical protein P3T76_006484 [Phytophthora citrophthora]